MNKPEKRFVLYQKVFEGTTKQCAEFLELAPHLFRNAHTARGKYKDCIIEDISPPDMSTASAIQAWDDFVEPLRELYGIPVSRMYKEDLLERMVDDGK